MVAPETKITNCHHSLTQLFVEPDDNSLHLVTYQRSADVICGVPHNWIQTWAFLLWLAHRTGRQVGSVQWVGGDCHVYDEHAEVAKRIVAAPAPLQLPELRYAPTSDEFKADDFYLDRLYLPTMDERVKMII